MYLKSERELYRRRRRAPLRLLITALFFAVGGYVLYHMLRLQGGPLAEISTPTPVPTPTRAALSYVAEAEEAYWDGRLGEAITAYQQALDLEPNQTDLYLELSRLLTFYGQPERGLEMAREAVRRQPENARAWALLGMAYDWLGLPYEAINTIERAVGLDPTLPEAYAYLAEAYIDAGNWFEANSAIATAIELDEKNVDALRNQGYVLENQGNYSGAIEAYRRGLEVHNKLAHLHLAIGRNAAALGNYALALEAYKDAVEADPGNATALDRLGWTYVLLGEYGKAQPLLEKAISLNPALPEAHGHLATLLFQNRNYEDAIEAFKPALRYGEARSRRRTVFFVVTEEEAGAVGPLPGGREIARAAFIHPAEFEMPLRGILSGAGEAAGVSGRIRLDVMNGRYTLEMMNVPPAPPGKAYVGWFVPLMTPERTRVRTAEMLPTPDGRMQLAGETGPVKGPPIENYYSLALCYYLLDECDKARPYIEIALRIDPDDANAQQTWRLCGGE